MRRHLFEAGLICTHIDEQTQRRQFLFAHLPGEHNGAARSHQPQAMALLDDKFGA